MGGGVGRRGEVGHELLGEVHGLAARAGRGVMFRSRGLNTAEGGGSRGLGPCPLPPDAALEALSEPTAGKEKC